MNKTIVFLVLLAFYGCIQHQENETISTIEEQMPSVEVKYASGFEIETEEGYLKVKTHSFGKNAFYADSVYVLIGTKANVPEDVKTITTPVSKIACQSSTYLAYLNQLNALKSVTGLCGMDYVKNDSVRDLLMENGAKELCLVDQIQTEALLGAEPDLLLTYPFGGIKDYQNIGVQTLLIAEYLEETQLARLEWIKLFGVLTNQVEEANAYFQEVEKVYNRLVVSENDTKKQFIMNLPFNGAWFMPSQYSVGVRLIEDAGLNYFYKSGEGTENRAHSNEEVWNDGTIADYWVIVAERPEGFSLEDLIKEAPVYQTFKSVKEKQVIFCNTATTDYFSEALVEPQVVLKDLLFATGQLKTHNPKYFFLLK